MDLETAKTRFVVVRLLRATFQLAKIVRLLADKLEKQEDKDQVKEYFEIYLKALDDALETLEEGMQK